MWLDVTPVAPARVVTVAESVVTVFVRFWISVDIVVMACIIVAMSCAFVGAAGGFDMTAGAVTGTGAGVGTGGAGTTGSATGSGRGVGRGVLWCERRSWTKRSYWAVCSSG